MSAVYLYMCVHVCAYVYEREREIEWMREKENKESVHAFGS